MGKLEPDAGKILKMMEKKDVKGLIGALIQASKPECTRLCGRKMAESITEEFVRIGKPAVGPLIKTLYSAHFEAREYIAEALAKIGEPAVDPLIWELRTKNRNVREYAAKILGRLGDKRAVEPLIKALEDDSSWIRDKAAWSLGELGDKKAVKPLIQSLTEYPDMRNATIEALGKLSDKRAVKPLINALDDEYPQVRRSAAWALGKIGDERAVEPLFRVISDGKSYLTNTQSMGEENVKQQQMLGQQVDTVLTAAEALGTMGKLELKPLIQALGEDDPSAREAAEWTLAQVKERTREK
ncbi:MAG: HEAT repeat domain-containing protein [Candidatus Freyarchaeum deiterrae]